MRSFERYARIPRANYAILNNLYNPNPGMSQAVTWDGGDGDADGWSWRAAGALGAVPASFPHLLVGTRPWGDHFASPLAPCRASDAADLAMDLSAFWSMSADAKANVALEIWVTHDFPSPGADRRELRKLEIMVWINAVGGAVPAGSIVERSDSYDVYSDMIKDGGTRWPYVAFRESAAQHQQSFAVKAFPIGRFVERCIEMGFLKSNEIVACIELGTEIWRGSGSFGVTDYRVHR